MTEGLFLLFSERHDVTPVGYVINDQNDLLVSVCHGFIPYDSAFLRPIHGEHHGKCRPDSHRTLQGYIAAMFPDYVVTDRKA